MASKRSKIGIVNENQLLLFDIKEQIEHIEQLRSQTQEPDDGTLNVDARLRDSLAAALKTTNLKRREIACRMSGYLGIEITESMLNCWTADSKEGYRFPAAYVPAFCRATSNYSLLKVLCSASGCEFVESDDVALLIEARMTDTIRQQMKELREFKKYREKRQGE